MPNIFGVHAKIASSDWINAGQVIIHATSEYIFTITSASVVLGDTYSNNGQTFYVNTASGTVTSLATNGTGNPTASGTLVRTSGTGPLTLTFSAVTTSLVSYGTMTFNENTCRYRRIGDSAEFQMILNTATAGTATNGNGQYIYTLPSGLLIDVSKAPAAQGITGGNAQPTQVNASVGHGTNMSGGTTMVEGFIGVYNATGVSFYQNDQLAGSGSGQGPNGSGRQPLTSISCLVLNFTVPILGWTSADIVPVSP